MKNISITEKLIFYFVILGIVVITIIGNYSYYFANKALLNRTFDQLTSLRLEKKNRIEQFFLDRQRDVNLFSNSKEIKEIITDLNSNLKNRPQSNEIKNNSYLLELISSNGYYNRLYLINKNQNFFVVNQPDKNINSAIPKSSLLEFSKKLEKTKGPIFQDLNKANPFILVGTSILTNDSILLGSLVIEIPVSSLNKIMFEHSENNGLGKTGETYLVSDDSLMRSNSRFEGNAVLKLKVTSKSVIEAFKGKTGVQIIDDYRNISCLSSYSKVNVKGLNWVILAEIDEMEAMTPIYSIRNSILLISVIIASCVFLFAFIISKRITVPIKRLQKASEQIGEGNYEVNVKVTSQDEIGLLTETFNNMISQLKKQTEEIEIEKMKRVRSLIDGQEIERKRLARDLHDSLGQSILTVKIKLEEAKNAEITKKQTIIFETQELLKNIINDIRNISNDLMPPVLEAFGIEQGLNKICKDTEINTGIKVQFYSNNIPDNLDKKIQIYLYRIAQEAINNITKHSDATDVHITISCQKNTISLNISDNGKGFDINKNDTNGNGIMNIKERVELLKGEYKITSTSEKGTQIDINIPTFI